MDTQNSLESKITVSLSDEEMVQYAVYLEQELRRKAKTYGFSFDDIQTEFLCLKDKGKQTVGVLLPASGDIEIPFHQVFLCSPAVWLIIDPADGRIVEANQAAADFYGYFIKELKGMKISKINVMPEEKIREYLLHVSNRAAGSTDFQHRLKNRQLRDVTVYSAPFITSNKILYSFIVVDVTARKKAEINLKNSRDRLAVVIEATGAGIWEWDILKGNLILDTAWKRLMGYEENELIKPDLAWEKYCHSDDVPAVRQAVTEALQRNLGQFSVENRLRRKNGTYFWVKASAHIICDQQKKPLRILGSIMDITRHKRDIELQREKSSVLRGFAQVIADKGFILDEDGSYVEVFGDPSLLPLPREKFYEKTLFDLLPAERADFFLKAIRKTIAEGKVRRGKIQLELPIGRRIFDARAAVIDYKVKEKKTVAVVMTDITDQEKIRERLQASYEMRRRSDIFNDLLNGIRHLDEDIIAYIKNLQLNFSHALFCCAIHLNFEKENEAVDILQYLKDEIINSIHGMEGCVAWSCRGSIGVVCQNLHYADNQRISQRKLAEDFYALIVRECPDITIHIGIGEMQKGLKGFYKSFQQAWDAAEALRQGLTSGKNIIYFRELGVFQLLLNQEGKDRAIDFTYITIRKLIQYDCEKGTDYLSTLEVILQSANLKEAAETLFLHHNTVVFRKKRIEEILGQSITNFETKLSLALAIKFYRMSTNKK